MYQPDLTINDDAMLYEVNFLLIQSKSNICHIFKKINVFNA